MEHYDWNEGWQFTPQFTPELLCADYHGPALQKVRIPHTAASLPYNYAQAESYQMVCGYRREFSAPDAWRGRRVLMTFGAVAHQATVWCNGMEVARHACGYTAFTADLSGALRYGGQTNVIALRCDSRETLDIPPFGHVVDYLTYGGMYRGVSLDVKESAYLKDVFLTAGADGAFRLYPAVEGEATGCILRAALTDPDGQDAGVFSGSAALPLSGSLNLVRLWSPDFPALYTLRLQLIRTGCTGSLPDHCIDERVLRFGFRTLDFRADGLYLNGKKIRLRGLDRHQSWPYQGYAMPDSLQRQDALLLRRLGCNAVRTSHYPQSHAFLDACDELGLLVFTEIPGWQHIGGESWKQQALTNCREMVLQYRNHTCIFAWGVRINESLDDDELYRKTNEIAHRLDPTRPTSGVRNFRHSRCLEDVYAYNDFVHTGKNAGCEPRRFVCADMRKGYLITEYNGHMFPTKTFDWEGKRTEHALRHARVLADAAAQKDVAGCLGWCLFDYNTHRDFGSGDGICYHGVTDMFRNPKPAAAVYASQKDALSPADVVLEVCSSMDIGEYPGGNLPDVTVFTNADRVRLYKNDRFVAEFEPNRKGRYGALPHPPIFIDDLVGCLLETCEGFEHGAALQLAACMNAVRRDGPEVSPLVKAQMARLLLQLHLTAEEGTALYLKYVGNWGESAVRCRFEAVWGGTVARTVTKEPVRAVHLEARALNPVLTDGPAWDAAAVQLRAADQNGNTLPYFAEAVRLTVEGPARLIGPDVVPLRGGMAGTYLATTGRAGTVCLTARCEGCAPARVRIEVQMA